MISFSSSHYTVHITQLHSALKFSMTQTNLETQFKIHFRFQSSRFQAEPIMYQKSFV